MDACFHHIDGRWIDTGRRVPDVSPSDADDIVGWFHEADANLAEQAVRAARKAFPGWRRVGLMERSRGLERIARGLEARLDEIGTAIAREEGKLLRDARGEVQRAADIFRFYAGEVLRIDGGLHDSLRPGVTVEVTREPLGVVALITPWNFPIAIPAWKTAAALAYGNCVVLKPSEITPAGAWLLAQVIEAAGLPPGVFNLVMGTGAALGSALTAAPGVDGVSFTGSVPTGQRIALAAAATQKKLQMEMGGKNALVVLDDADLDLAVDCALDGAFHATGQRCTASSRLIVTPGIHDRFVEALQARMAQLRVGHALDADVDIGPVVSEAQLRKNLGYIALAREEGGQVLGGGVLERRTRGHFLAPCLVTGLGPQARVCQEEVFGPFACVIRANDEEDALAITNATPFGLSAGICTTSLASAAHFRRHVETGLCMVNLPTSGVDFHVPFGGNKASSHGPREQGRHSAEFFTSIKTAYVRP